jgi:hypothetical protein
MRLELIQRQTTRYRATALRCTPPTDPGDQGSSTPFVTTCSSPMTVFVIRAADVDGAGAEADG